jgi:tetratricopeptide (TPR) repeat protein
MAAICRARRLMFRQVANREAEEVEAERLARRAARLGANDAMALSAAAVALLIASRDFDGSIALVERALMLNPNLGFAWFVSAFVRLYNGEPELAIAHLGGTMRLSPFDSFLGVMWQLIALAHLLTSRYDQALLASEQGLPNTVLDLNILAACSALAGRMDKARAAMARIRERDPALSVSTFRVVTLFRRPEDSARLAEGLRLAGLPE